MGIRSRAALYIERDRPLIVDEVDHGDPGDNEVVVRVLYSGICHSFLHRFHMPNVALPHAFGHEATGVVEQAGRNVTRAREGDFVLVTWLPGTPFEGFPMPRATLRWKSHTVQTVNVYTWADHCRLDENYVVPLERPDDIVSTSIIGCAVMTGAGAVTNTAGVRAGQTVAVFGCGGVGLSAVQAAANVGAAMVIAVDVDDAKLAFARRFGATDTVDARAGDAVQAVRDLTSGGVDYAFDTIGLPQTVQQVVLATRPGVPGLRRGGTTVLVGVCLHPPPLDLSNMLGGSKTVMSSQGGDVVPDVEFARYLQWYRDGSLPLDELVTRRYTLEQINEALDDLEHGRILGRAVFECAGA